MRHLGLGREPGGGPRSQADFSVHARALRHQAVEECAFRLDICKTVFRSGLQTGERLRDLVCPAPVESGFGPLALLNLSLVLSAIVRGGFLIVARQRLEGLVGNAFPQHVMVEDADQAVAAADMAVEKGERLAGLQRLDPERDLA